MIDTLNRAVNDYVRNPIYRAALGLPEEVVEEYHLYAKGEYNANYCFVHPLTGEKLLLRVNLGSQMGLEHQIEYEANALRILAKSKHTPLVLFRDGSKEYIDYGVLVMTFLPGTVLDYCNEEELEATARCLADIHSLKVCPDSGLIQPKESLRAILEECEAMLKVYVDSDLGDPDKKIRLRSLLDRAWEITREAEESGEDISPYLCCINTELNSTNFLCENISLNSEMLEHNFLSEETSLSPEIIEHEGNSIEEIIRKGETLCGCEDTCRNRETHELNAGTGISRKYYVNLVDWEKPLYGDPAQDLGHFLAPTTTFWKTDIRFTPEESEHFIDEYIEAVSGRFDTTGLRERTHQFIRVTCLRGLTWCAMAWVEYQDPMKLNTNESTRIKLDQYLDDNFLDEIERFIG